MLNSEFHFVDCFNDDRLDRRASELVEALVCRQTTVIRQLASKRAQMAAFYRLLDNEKIEPRRIIDELSAHCAEQIAAAATEHVLVLSDTSELNFSAHEGRLQPDTGLGVVGRGSSLERGGAPGLYLHAALALDADSGRLFGFSAVRTWARENEAPTTEGWAHQRLPIEQKESYRWIAVAEDSRQVIARSTKLTVVADAESDIYQLYARHREHGCELLVAARGNRHILQSDRKLLEHLDQQAPLGTYCVELRQDRRKKRPSRTATLELRSVRVRLKRPARVSAARDGESVEMTAVLARETSLSAGTQKAIDWLLLTTHPAETYEQARQIVSWYQRRWNIEQLFRTLKKKGLNLEDAQLEKGDSLERLGLLTLVASLAVLRLELARDGDTVQSIDDVFSSDEQECLERVQGMRFRGRGADARNPHDRHTLAWASWIIARLGGWKGARTEAPPGPITFFRGLKEFYVIYDGWLLARSEP